MIWSVKEQFIDRKCSDYPRTRWCEGGQDTHLSHKRLGSTARSSERLEARRAEGLGLWRRKDCGTVGGWAGAECRT